MLVGCASSWRKPAAQAGVTRCPGLAREERLIVTAIDYFSSEAGV